VRDKLDFAFEDLGEQHTASTWRRPSLDRVEREDPFLQVRPKASSQ
jgi:hypothetical protein